MFANTTRRAATDALLRASSAMGPLSPVCGASSSVRAAAAAPAMSSMMLASLRTQIRGIGDRGVPEEYGQPKTGGTGFLGTPKNHRALLEKRPMSPDVFAADGGWGAHYKFPPVALSSITNRVSGIVLSGALSTGGVIALVAGPEAVPATVDAFKHAVPMLVVPAKFALSFPFVFHTLGGFRHLIWDTTMRGINNKSANTTSLALFGVSAAASAALAVYTW